MCAQKVKVDKYAVFGNERKEQIKKLYNTLQRYSLAPELYYKIHERGNIEYLLASNDLTAGEIHGSPPQRARQFLLRNRKLLGLFNLDYHLFIKHTLTSQMGTHCIFGLRDKGKEMTESSFVVHLDRDDHIVMVTSVYQPPDFKTCEPSIDYSDRELPSKLNKKIEMIAKRFSRFTKVTIRVEPMCFPDWEEETYQVLWQVKIITPANDVVVLYNADGKAERAYTVCRGVAPDRKVLGRVYRDFWLDSKLEGKELRDVLQRDLETVVLRDLRSNLELIGRYVAVRDDVVPYHYWDSLNSTNLQIRKGDLGTSWLDRMMAYYHTDLIQRHFRELGLDVLDEYLQFNPMHVVLDNRSNKTYYGPNEHQIHLRRLDEELKCTDARDARIVYHEFVHAVTDALARLGRQDQTEKKNRRHHQILQAAAMDEGSADYFACSLAARQGMRRAYFYSKVELREKHKRIQLKVRRLGTINGQSRAYNLKIAQSRRYLQRDPEETIYAWGRQWGRYLWKLRCELGAQVADTVIAHSFFFLTRWSTFGLGVLAIVLADRLLFEGIHEDTILEAGEDAKDWSVLR